MALFVVLFMMLQLNPPIPLLTPKGPGRAIIVIDYSEDHDLVWTCFIDSSGEIWSFRNQEVRQVDNLTFGRGLAFDPGK